MKRTVSMALAAACTLSLVALTPQSSFAAGCEQLQPQVLSIARKWAQIKYLSKSDSVRGPKMNALGTKADRLAKRHPRCVNVLIWDGIINSEKASFTWGLSALHLANTARDLLQKAYRMDPKALDAGAATSLGVLYYRVPGFPLGWGDKKKARRLLKKAVRLAPNGRDAHYFYADFLYEQGEYRKAERVLKKGLKLPDHPERPLWNKKFPKVMQALLAKVKKKERS